MYFRFSTFDYLTLGLLALTIVLGVSRFVVARFDRSWPLVYYAALIVYWKSYEGLLNGYWVLAGVACGLLMRFEFLGKAFYKVVRAAELIVLLYVAVCCVRILAQ